MVTGQYFQYKMYNVLSGPGTLLLLGKTDLAYYIVLKSHLGC